VDFLLAPYLSEPIGQSDVEMGFLGVPWKAGEGETQGYGQVPVKTHGFLTANV